MAKGDKPLVRLVSAETADDEVGYERALRPLRFEDFVGQEKHKENLRVFVEAAKRRGAALDHVLLCGPPGLGKTTLAHILAHELGVELTVTQAPALEHKGQLATLLTKLQPREILFIDEIHRLPPVIEESLYSAIEDFVIDVVHGDGAYASAIRLPLPPFTLVGATTRTGLLTSPLRSRFAIPVRLDYYTAAELAAIVQRSARLLQLPITDGGAEELARRSRGTPRIANNLLRRARDFAEVLGDGRLDGKNVKEALDRLDVDEAGLDEMDRRLLLVIIEHHQGGPVGIETLGAALSEPRGTLEDVYEPYLIQQGFIARTARGRIATDRAYKHLQIPIPETQQRLF